MRRFAIERPASHSRSDAVVRKLLPLADALARRFERRFSGLIEFNDARQVAGMDLDRSAAACLKAGFPPGAFLKLCIQGALRHFRRDYGRVVRVLRSEHEKGVHLWGHQSLDAQGPSG